MLAGRRREEEAMQVIEVRGTPGVEHYLVRWRDRHESIFYPGSTSHAVHPKGRRPDAIS
jgi:hypothetical protein